MRRTIATMAASLIIMTTTLCAAAEPLLGIWTTEQAKSKVEIFRCGEK